MKYVFDTTILIDFLRGYPPSLQFVKVHCRGSLLPATVVAELYAGAKTQEDARDIEILIAPFVFVGISLPLARRAGQLRRRHGIALGDAIIAAVAKENGAKLLTHNTSHFPMVKAESPYPPPKKRWKPQ